MAGKLVKRNFANLLTRCTGCIMLVLPAKQRTTEDTMTSITYTDGSKGEATIEEGRHGGYVLVLRKGFPVAAEVVAGVKVEHVTDTLLASLGVAGGSVRDLGHDWPSLIR